MSKILLIILLLASATNLSSQTDTSSIVITELQAKEAINKIVRFTGLLPNFIVRENKEVKTAVAFIKNKKRYIEFNPEIISSIVDSTSSDWSAVSILAHEIAHHLLGHTLLSKEINPGDELACDKFSGFVMYLMGASLEKSLSAMEVAGSVKGDHIHPPKKARLEAIRMGWEEAKTLQTNPKEVTSNLSKENFRFLIVFEADENNYYVTKDNDVVWYNNFAKPIKFGDFSDSENDNYQYVFQWSDQRYFIDNKLKIWQKTSYGALMIVGEMVEL